MHSILVFTFLCPKLTWLEYRKYNDFRYLKLDIGHVCNNDRIAADRAEIRDSL